MFCPSCKEKFSKGITYCPNCKVDLVEKSPKEKKRISNRAITIMCRLILIVAIGFTLLTWVTDLFVR